MILVDTSVWIAAFRAKSPVRIEDAVEFEEIVTCLPVLHRDRDFNLLSEISPLKARTIS